MKVVYVSYDGALDPLGSSQVVPYILGLAARGVSFSLVTFEKAARWRDSVQRDALQRTLDDARVRWVPLSYHQRPRLLAKGLDFVAGRRAIRRELGGSAAAIVHCRGDVAMAMARAAARPATKILYDIRGFFSDERTQAGSWRRGSVTDRAVRRIEAANWVRADAVVTLTQAAIRELEGRHGAVPPHRVIPTCVDLTRFSAGAVERPEFSVAYGGSLGSGYPTAEILAFARIAAAEFASPALLVTPQPEDAVAGGATPDWCQVVNAPAVEMPSRLRTARAAFCLYRPGAYAAATSPTKLGEALAMGLPVAVNKGIGDLDEILRSGEVGVLIDAFTPESYRSAAIRLRQIADDPATAARCRRMAEERFALAMGIDRYRSLYEELASAPTH